MKKLPKQDKKIIEERYGSFNRYSIDKNKKRILVIRLSDAENVLLSTAILPFLRDKYSEHLIAFATYQEYRFILNKNSNIDTIITIPKGPASFAINGLEDVQYSTVINLQCDYVSMKLTAAAHSSIKYGAYFHKSQPLKQGLSYFLDDNDRTLQKERSKRELSIIDIFKDITNLHDIDISILKPSIYLRKSKMAKCREKLNIQDNKNTIACWFGTDIGVDSIPNNTVEDICRSLRFNNLNPLVINKSAQLDDILYTIANCDGLLCVNSFAMHVGAILNKPVLCLAVAIDKKKCSWSGQNITFMTPLRACYPCFKKECTIKCIDDFKPSDIATTLSNMIGG